VPAHACIASNTRSKVAILLVAHRANFRSRIEPLTDEPVQIVCGLEQNRRLALEAADTETQPGPTGAMRAMTLRVAVESA